MPWKSKAQARWGHTAEGEKTLGGKSSVSEWDSATVKGSLPDKVRHPGVLSKATKKITGR